MKMAHRIKLVALCILLTTVIFPRTALATPKKAARHSSKQVNRPLTVKQVAQLVLPSVVRLTVLGKDGVPAVQGSGLVVGDDLIATNLHVVAGGHAVTANFDNGRSETVFGVVGVDSEHDLVLLRAFTHGVRTLPLEPSTSVQIGDPVIAVGSPEGLGGSISTGVVSGIRLYSASKVIQTTAPISHGSSGGGLIDMNGRVIGVTSFFVTDGQNLNFAYPAYFLHQLIIHQARQVSTWKEIEDYQPQATVSVSNAPVKPSGTTSRVADTAVQTTGPLEGVREVQVVIGAVADDAKQYGLDADAIKATVESHLRRAGVPIVSELSYDEQKPGIYLNVLIDTLALDDGARYVYVIRLDAQENVSLSRTLPIRADTTTWNKLIFGVISKNTLSSVLNTVTSMTDDFAGDFLTQNHSPHL